MLAGNPIGQFPTVPSLTTFDGPRNFGTVSSLTYNERESSSRLGQNDSPFTAEQLPLGNLPGQRNTIDVRGTLSFEPGGSQGFRSDQDYYSFDLKAGDILDVAALGSVSSFNIFLPSGQIWVGQDAPLPGTNLNFYPVDSPLQTLGNVYLAQVAPFDGKYMVSVTADNINSSYTLGLRTYRPVTESLPIGQSQIVYLDFDGGLVPRDEFNVQIDLTGVFQGGSFRVPPIEQTLQDTQLVVNRNIGAQQYRSIANTITQSVKDQYNDLENYTGNGSYRLTGNPGDFGITILNSYDDPEPVGVPFTRVMFGSIAAFPEIAAADNLLGVAKTIDVGNFDLNDTVLVFVDNGVDAGLAVPTSSAISAFDSVGLGIGVTTTHELAHVFGLFHTDGNNFIPSIIDGGGALNNENGLGVGADGILGTEDDVPIRFRTDRVDPDGAVTFGNLYSGESLAYSLSTGKQGRGLTGRVYNDVNGDGQFTGDSGLAGVTVFLDTNRNGIQDATDPTAVTDANGGYSLTAAAGTYTLYAVAPDNFVISPTGVVRGPLALQTITVGAGSGTAAGFGFTQVNPDITGKKFVDLNSNGVLDPGEPGIPGAYIYADLDGDNRPDLFEPSAVTDENGNYTLQLDPIGRPFAIREVEQPGFERTVPLSGEYIVNYTGGPLGSSYNFGGFPSRDYGDAPDSYKTTLAQGGPSHGINNDIRIGNSIDRELDGQPTTGADGDDQVVVGTTQIDDEDGVILVRPLSLSGPGQFQITLFNATGKTGYLQAWMDFNGDGDFLDANEKIVNDGVYGTGTATINVSLPAGFNIDADGTNDRLLDTFARFRYSTTPGLGVGGSAVDGEVEDHPVRIVESGNLTNPDNYSVSQNTTTTLDVLANDFNPPSNPLTITNATSSLTGAVVRVSSGAAGQQTLIYTPPNNFTGRDVVTYFVRDLTGNVSSNTATINVNFQTNRPIAIDDLFEVPSTAKNEGLNVLDNDISSTQGGLSIASFTGGNRGGKIELTNGVLRYTPAPGFTDSEQFDYTVVDGAGQTSSATVTVVLTNQAFQDDLASYKVQILDENNDTELLTLQAGQTFRVRVSADDLSKLDSVATQGLRSAFTDLLYTSELVTPVDTNGGDAFPFDITFGPKFKQGIFQAGNTQKPGVYEGIGSAQSEANLNSIGSSNDRASHVGFTEVFTVTMRATGVGIAKFQTDPTASSDRPFDPDAKSETILIGTDVSLSYDKISYGSTFVPIVPAGDGFPVALDDSYPLGTDSLGRAITSASPARLNVLANDVIGTGDVVTEFGIRVAPGQGNATVNNNGTATKNDDFIEYTPSGNNVGFDQFSYILTVQSAQFGLVRSIANVTVVTGGIQNAQAQYDFTFVNEAGTPITSVATGQRFGVRIDAINLTVNPRTAVYGGFLDLLYSSNLIETIAIDTGGNPDLFDFEVDFDRQFARDPAVGVNDRPGLIDEFGTIRSGLGGAGLTLATIYFRALRPGNATVTGSPADRFPFQDTLLLQNDAPVPVSRILYDSETIQITGGGSQEPLHNAVFPADVNNDNLVTAIDALLIINEMSRRDAAGEPGSASGGGSTNFVDVNGDGYVTAIDALRVINYLNEHTGPAGEPIVQNVQNEFKPIVAATSPATSETIELLSGDPKVVGAGSSDPVSVVAPPQTQVSDASNTDDDDDLLALLADDIANQWNG